MADVTQAPLQTADGRPLKAALAAAQARAKRRAFLLVLPLLAFVVLTFVIPILTMLERSFDHDGFAANAPATVAWLQANPGEPTEEAYAALVQDLAAMQKAKTAGAAGTRINYTYPGTISIFKEAAREAAKLQPPYKEAMLALDPKWGDPLLWVTFRHAASRFTTDFYMVPMDLRRTADDGLTRTDPDLRIHLQLFAKTFGLSAITGLCLVLALPDRASPGHPADAQVEPPDDPGAGRSSGPRLVRTSSWIALGQESGIINDLLWSDGGLGRRQPHPDDV